MVQPPTWALTVSDAIRYCNLRPWQPRLALAGKPEPLPHRLERLRSAWAKSRLCDGKRAAEFNTSILEAALHRSAKKRVPADPVPMDFSAWFEVFLDGAWHTVDARHNRPRIGRILMARGRDATDAAISTAFGNAKLAGFRVITEEVQPARA